MPHKRAKRTVREKLKSQQGADMAPGKQHLSKEDIPKSFSRVINASAIRQQWREKKRKLEDSGNVPRAEKRRKLAASEDNRARVAEDKAKERRVASHTKIKPGESLQHFNRRVEDDMRPLVKAAMQSSNAVARNARKAEIDAKKEKKRQKGVNTKSTPGEDGKVKVVTKPIPASPPPVTHKHAGSAKEFVEHSSSAPRRLNDIAQAPPEFKKLPRGAVAVHGGIGSGKREGVLSMAQKSMMEQEREKAIARYRELKAHRRGNIDDRDKGGEKE